MPLEALTYAEFGRRLGVSPEAARKKAHALRLPATLGNDGKKRVSVDLLEIQHAPRIPRSTAGGRPDTGTAIPVQEMLKLIDDLRAETGRKAEQDVQRHRVLELEAQTSVLEAELTGLRHLIEAERKRADAAEGDRDAWRNLAQRPWWRRLAG